ncbi:HDIG domain-containing protein [Kovacikia minuta CCNUW1]|uniref:HD family phosphohydrolase n=1 Tax=Kovacikia minuta TaxID=2931930 RepID=UPI001CCD5F87|nr:HDIG domain-containing metalloprotein [Kovacikia minuta]UBF26650.1 HDIG domain-containing protein [Kovacikia minuta CCNUW1]
MKRLRQLVQQFERPRLPHAGQRIQLEMIVQRLPKSGRLTSSKARSCFISVLAVISLTSALGHRFYNTPKLDVRKASPQTVYAPETITIEDRKATEEKQKAARTSAISVLMLDQSVNAQIRETIHRQIDQGNELRRLAGPFPFTKTSLLSLQTQGYLRKASEADWQKILSIADPTASLSQLENRSGANNLRISKLPDGNQRRALTELLAYPQAADSKDYLALLQAIEQARSQYISTLSSLSQATSPNAKSGFDASLLDLTDSEWKQAQPKIPAIAERVLAQGISEGLTESILENAVKLQVKGVVPTAAEPVAVRLLLSSLQPNLIQDTEQTRLRAEQAAQQVTPEMVSIRQGDVIVRAGEEITTGDFALLDHFGLSRRGINWSSLIGFGVVVAGAVIVYGVVERRFHPGMRRRDRVLIWLLSLSTPLLIALHVPSTNLPAVGLLVGSFYGSPLGLAVSGLLALLLPIGMNLPLSHLLSSATSGLLCGWMAGQLRSREELALLGTAAGILQGGLYLLLNVASGMVWYTLLGSAAIHALLGLAWSIVAIGGSAHLEQLFDLVTTIRLVELANPNRPLLKDLAAKTPGTFQHTLFVATLAEAAARALGCNVELVRTGTLYHDIGKMHDPQGFIENQMGGPNKHDLINDPWKSAEIIKKHVSEGLVMARKYRLPKAVQAFIPEHQGTMLIAYFYHQAQQLVQQVSEPTRKIPALEESDFRYDGPAPQSRETGIVMLADSCEAALRSLKDATAEEALSMINKILRARWQDKQLVDSGLTREDLGRIAAIFVEVWQQFNQPADCLSQGNQQSSVAPSARAKPDGSQEVKERLTLNALNLAAHKNFSRQS